MNKPKFKTRSTLFESTYVKGDKITLHKCVIDKAIKEIKADSDIFLEEERSEECGIDGYIFGILWAVLCKYP